MANEYLWNSLRSISLAIIGYNRKNTLIMKYSFFNIQ
jgi:hypothetical protein